MPGPTLRIGRGEELRVRVVNDLAEPTSVHWHGVRDERPIARLVYQRGSEARRAPIGAAPVPAQSAGSGRSCPALRGQPTDHAA